MGKSSKFLNKIGSDRVFVLPRASQFLLVQIQGVSLGFVIWLIIGKVALILNGFRKQEKQLH